MRTPLLSKDFQNILTNSLAEADHKIESNPEMLGLRDITNMDVTVQNKNNLEKPRVRKKLEEETKKNKANITKGKRKVEKGEADLKENILKVKKDVAGLKENRMKQRKGNAKLQENQLKLTSLPKKPRGAFRRHVFVFESQWSIGSFQEIKFGETEQAPILDFNVGCSFNSMN
ncbi:3-methyl-2-oxobutanoate hydroxymethyltransferase [Gossypium australe]|uniref:3-methyl-2-oxobutanoate hydroxymethyltransferase n=1 Tax=Gossypium australe TaxID=47621 RepID=A0A5B6UNE9_9ROSI|nr:3-methyl-2-oxobutanoate hydroxymethyltransferase [Gossypium australe]